jgi:hypothetical protein
MLPLLVGSIGMIEWLKPGLPVAIPTLLLATVL